MLSMKRAEEEVAIHHQHRAGREKRVAIGVDLEYVAWKARLD